MVPARSPRPAFYALMLAGSGVAALLGFGREAALGALFGASRASDAFYAALAIPFTLAYFVVGGALAPALTAALAAHLEKRDVDAARQLVRKSLTWVGVSGVALAALLGLASGALTRVLVPGFAPDETRLTAALLCELLPYGVCSSLALLAAAGLNAAGDFGTPVTAVLSANAVSLAVLLLTGRAWGIHGAAWALSSGSLLQLVISLARLAGAGLLGRAAPGTPAAPIPWRASGILALSLALAGTVDLGERLFASSVGVGAIALLAFASKLIHLPMRLFAAPLTAIAFPRLVRARQRDGAFTTREADATARLALDLLFYAAAVTAGAAGPLVALTMGRGRFDAASVAVLARLLFLLSPAIVALGVVEMAAKYLLAADRPGAIVRAQAAGLAVYLVLASLLTREGVEGLAIARDAAWGTAALGLVLPLYLARKEKPAAFALLRPLAAAALAAGLVAVVVRQMPGGSFVRLSAAALLGGAAFLLMVFTGRPALPVAVPRPEVT